MLMREAEAAGWKGHAAWGVGVRGEEVKDSPGCRGLLAG